MHRAYLGVLTLVTWILIANPELAAAQFASVPAVVLMTTHMTVWRTVNGQSTLCDDNLAGDSAEARFVLYPQIGESSDYHRRFFCGDVAIDYDQSLTTAELQRTDYLASPSQVTYRAALRVVYDGGAGTSVNVWSDEWTFQLTDHSTTPLIHPINPPGVVFEAVWDDIQTWLDFH
jgi:hypothetical protein